MIEMVFGISFPNFPNLGWRWLQLSGRFHTNRRLLRARNTPVFPDCVPSVYPTQLRMTTGLIYLRRRASRSDSIRVRMSPVGSELGLRVRGWGLRIGGSGFGVEGWRAGGLRVEDRGLTVGRQGSEFRV